MLGWPAKSPDDIVIVSALRTAITKGGKGGFKETHPEFYLAKVLQAAIKAGHVDPATIGDVQVGNVCMPGAGVTTTRMACLFAGMPDTVPAAALNRQCSSGLAACANIAGSIKAGYIDIGIGAGVESMSM
ncbi:putative acetyl-CoA acetyltransferase, partial [Caulochytrium protostelioides]